MKISKLLVLALATALAATACKKTPTKLTPIPGGPTGPAAPVPGDENAGKAARGREAPPGVGRGGTIGEMPGPPEGNIGAGPIRTELPPTVVTPPPPAPVKPTNIAEPEQPFPGEGNREILQADSVYFEFDSSVVRAGERPKLAAVVDYLKGNPTKAVRIEGNCDERGTEEYNRSLGERRALALREGLMDQGIEPGRIETVSFGKDKPRAPGHDETAWAENRRGDFVVMLLPAAR